MKYIGVNIDYDESIKGKAILVSFHDKEGSIFEVCFFNKKKYCHDLRNIHCKNGYGLFTEPFHIKKIYLVDKKPEALLGEPVIDLSELLKKTAREKNERNREKLKQILKLLL